MREEKEKKKIRNEGASSHRRDVGERWEGGRESLELPKVGEKRCYTAEGANCCTAKMMMANRWREKETEKLLFWRYLLKSWAWAD